MSYGARPLGSALGAIVGGLYGAEACLYLAAAIFGAQALVILGVAGGRRWRGSRTWWASRRAAAAGRAQLATVIASAAKQSILSCRGPMDCFAALAMTFGQAFLPNTPRRALPLPRFALYDISSFHIDPGTRHDRPDRRDRRRPPPEASSTVLQIAVLAALAATGTLATNILLPSLPQMAASLKVTSAAVTSAITIFLAVFAIGQLVVGPISDRYGRRWPVLIGFAVFFAGSVWCALATDLPSLLIGRVIQAAGACATSVLSRAIARDLFSGAALARAMALIMIAMAAAPGFSPLLGGALDHYVRLALRIRAGRGLCGARRRSPMRTVFGETHHATRTPLDPLAIAKNYLGLIADRRFVVPAATVSLIMGGLFAMFSAAPRILIEAMHFTPIQLGLFFAGTVLIVFAAGMLATRLAPRYGLDRSIRGGLLRGRYRQHRDAAGLAVQPDLPFRISPRSACSCSAWASSIRSARRRHSPRSATRRARRRRWSASGR